MSKPKEMLAIIRVPAHASVFLLEDSEERIAWFQKKLAGVQSLVVVHTADTAIETLARIPPPQLAFLDHDLGLMNYAGYTAPSVGNGELVARFIADGHIASAVVIHSWNPKGALAMKNVLKGAVVIPFGQFDIEIAKED